MAVRDRDGLTDADVERILAFAGSVPVEEDGQPFGEAVRFRRDDSLGSPGVRCDVTTPARCLFDVVRVDTDRPALEVERAPLISFGPRKRPEPDIGAG